jgi:malonyl-CoA/methylmalonyl-CoA synthetase
MMPRWCDSVLRASARAALASRPALQLADGGAGAATQMTYEQLARASGAVASRLRAALGDARAGERVALLLPQGSAAFVAALYGTVAAGHCAVPLTPAHSADELAYAVDNAGARVLLFDEHSTAHAAQQIVRAAQHARPDGSFSDARGTVHALPVSATGAPAAQEQQLVDEQPPADALAMLVYTSGTTARPKGVEYTHAMLDAQTGGMHAAWRIGASDTVLNALPLHHVHGLVNALCTPLAAGGSVRLLPGFRPDAVWASLRPDLVSVFMGVPTMYGTLAQLIGSARAPT